MKSSDQSKAALLVLIVQELPVVGAGVVKLRKVKLSCQPQSVQKVRDTKARAGKLRTRGCCFLESSVRSSGLRINAQYHVLRSEEDSCSQLSLYLSLLSDHSHN